MHSEQHEIPNLVGDKVEVVVRKVMDDKFNIMGELNIKLNNISDMLVELLSNKGNSSYSTKQRNSFNATIEDIKEMDESSNMKFADLQKKFPNFEVYRDDTTLYEPEIGEGATSKVYKGLCKGKKCAIKVIIII